MSETVVLLGAIEMTKVRFETAKGVFEGTLEGEGIGAAIGKALPIASTVMRWGDEIYFDVPVKMKNTKPTRDVRVGDIGYLPDGPCLCIFFGKTPASKADEPRPASDVTVVGRTDAPVDVLRAIKEGTAITLERVTANCLLPDSPKPS